MRPVLPALCLAAAAAAPLAAQHPAPPTPLPPNEFRITSRGFELNMRPFRIIAGELHYARIPREHWRQRLRMAKAMGLNTVSTYVFWNYHETRPGEFDFRTGNRDLQVFLRLAQAEGLYVILRPGPYVCAEWDLGGIPSWLLKEEGLRIRTGDPRYLAAAERYLRRLYEEVRYQMAWESGPVILVQVENEYGSFGSDSSYRDAHLRMFRDAGFSPDLLFTADGDWLFDRGGIPGLLPTANGESDYDTLVRRVNAFNEGHGPYMVTEYYPGWLMHWGEPFPVTPVDSSLPGYEALLRRGASVNLYMFHGGTNFGFTSGANASRDVPFQPSMTSYDYDAPLTEAGWATPKYMAYRDAIRRVTGLEPPPVPEAPPVIAVPPVTLTRVAGLAELTARADTVRAEQPLTFEALDQDGGYVLYRTTVREAVSGSLRVEGLRDFGVVYVNGRRTAVLERRLRRLSADLAVPAGARLEILVENQGRINFGSQLGDERKGIVGSVTLAGRALTGWTMVRLPFDAVPAVSGAPRRAAPSTPALYRGTFTLARTGDTFLDLRGFAKGIVFVNGINLGRYWRVGPQQTLYLPGPWLREGVNEIVVFDQLGEVADPRIAGLERPILTALAQGR